MLLRAGIFTFLYLLPAILEFVKYEGLSPRSFTDWDESLYLRLAIEGQEIPFESLLSLSLLKGYLSDMYVVLAPNVVTNVLLGHLSAKLGLEAVALGLVLDITCLFLGYAIFAKLAEGFGVEGKASEGVAVGILGLPWLFSLSQMFVIPFPYFQNAVPVLAHTFPTPPVLRAVYTQISFLFFGGALLLLIRALREVHGLSRVRLFFSGTLLALSLYAYFFAWGAGLAVVCVVSLFFYCLKENRREKIFGDFLSFGIPFFLISGVGVPMLLSGASSVMKLTEEEAQFWFFRIDLFLLTCFLFIVLLVTRKQQKVFWPLLILFSVCVSQLVLFNIQPIIGKLVSPYHFTLFFLHPLGSFALLSLFFAFLKEERIRKIALSVLIFVALAVPYKRFLSPSTEDLSVKEFASLSRFIQENTHPEEIIAVLPYFPVSGKQTHMVTRTLPYHLQAVTNRQIFPLSPKRTAGESRVYRSRLISWLYRGEINSELLCAGSVLPLPGDIVSGVVTWSERRRARECARFEKPETLPLFFHPCSQLVKLRLSYVLHDSEFSLELPKWYQGFSKLVYESEQKALSRKFKLYALDLQAIEQMCKEL